MNALTEITNAPLVRRTLFKGAGALGAGAMLAQAGMVGQAAAQSGSDIQNILNVTATVEKFGVTFLTAGINNAKAGKFNAPIADSVIAVLQAARAQEQFHLDFFQGLGGRSLTDTFTIPDPKLVTDVVTFFSAVAAEEEREIAAQLASMKVFTAMGRTDLVKTFFQYAAEEAEHRVLANYVAGARPANDRAFEPMLYNTTDDIITALKQLGLIGGSGPAATYPGPSVIDPTNVIERTPGGPMVDCAAASASAASTGGTAQIPAQMPNTGGGYGASSAGWGLMGAATLGSAAVAALIQLRNRVHTADAGRADR